ncbi:hypothetical protein ACUVNS_003733 [Yersinia enterocolitica]|uniref:hypothetical protein n=1 Tax=Yersinia enterocolitica TaxID=630 RepID=UPI002B3F73B6|nr:hypothetical protein [Yersinia enterocolitica]EMC5232525.1 hypothetical protein [Yersinia enterocolitica]
MSKQLALKSQAISINDIKNQLQFLCREMDVIIELMPQGDNKQKFKQVDAMLRFFVYPRYGVNPHYEKEVITNGLPIDSRVYSIKISLCRFIWFVSQEDPRFANWLKGVARGIGKEMDKLLSADISALTVTTGQ